MSGGFIFIIIVISFVAIIGYAVDQNASTKSKRNKQRSYIERKRTQTHKEKAYKFEEMSKNNASKTQHKVKPNDPLEEEDDFFKKYDDFFDEYEKKYAETNYDKKK